ncbi:MAG TPA: Ig-like domain-containing protein [candidate division Zixibacteria bacterium]|nr:Ig-like domain-containing protein [candidate division Zixibacteria bacterium]
MVSISFVDNCVMIEWEDVTVQILLDMVVIIIGAIVITWYFLLLISMVTIIIFDITIIFYLTLVELILVLIYYTLEIKNYETQVVIVYEYIEIVFVFISISIWQLTFIFHFEFWFIQIIFLVDLVAFIIINQVRILFIPVIVPIFISVIYYVPVIMKEYVHIYLPYAAEQIFIDVYDEDLKFPAHTIQYLVKDQLGNPIVDATVSVDYNGTNYPATHVGGGIYEVGLPASNETETITVTATKQWYPDASLTYDLTVDWIAINETTTTTVTEEGALPIVPILASLFSISICALVINRKKRN